VIRTVAPRAEVHVRADFQVGGALFESDLVRALEDVLANDNPDIISMSAGVLDNVAGGPVGFQVFYERLRHHKGVVLVTAAGNDSSRQPFWPGASPWAVSVGALSPDWRHRAKFSNFGGWVDVYAPGEDLINAYPAGHYVYTEPNPPAPQATFTGLARWSGTSFSAPMVAGMIAARMSRTGENGTTAAAALVKIAQTQARLGTGPVLLPS
jgi:subtilisin family serine protease